MSAISFETILNSLIEKSKNQGYLIFDDITEACVTFELDIQDTDRLSSAILENGIILYEEKPKINTTEEKTEEYEDWAHNDYEPIFQEIIQMAPEQEYFINCIRNIIPPQRQEMKTLQYQVLEGNQFARKRVIEMHLRLAVKIALDFAKRYKQELSDMISLACEGLCKATDSFKPDINGKFSGYASYWVMQKIMRDIKTYRPLVYYPPHFMEKYFSLRKNIQTLDIQNDEMLSSNSLHKIMNLLNINFSSAKKIAECFMPFESIDDIDNSTQVNEKIIEWDFQAPAVIQVLQDPSVLVIRQNLQEKIQQILSTLPERFQHVLIMRNGLYFFKQNHSLILKNMNNLFKNLYLSSFEDTNQIYKIEKEHMSIKDYIDSRIVSGEELTLGDIGTFLGVTKERIRQIESKSLKRLRFNKDFIELYKCFCNN